MDRRSFFSFLKNENKEMLQSAEHSNPERTALSTGLEPITTPLTLAQVYHLLRRITFAPTVFMANQLVGKTSEEAVELMLGNGNDIPPVAPNWVDKITENPQGADIFTRNSIEGQWSSYYGDLVKWWAELMRTESGSFVEKLTQFWSSHFTTEFSIDGGYIPPQLLYRQNKLIREHRLGNFRQFAKDITVDGAMLVYLGGILNTRKRPNENYGRELMELFTCGLGQYSEGDVKEAARVLTGWRVGQFNDEPRPNGDYETYFSPLDHDTGSKQVLGSSIVARDADTNTEHLVKTQEINKLIDIIFDIRGDAIARFISRKVYRYFVYSSPNASDENVIEEMATVFKQNNFEIRPLIAILLKSAHFFDEANIGIQIKTPVEYVVGFARQLSKPFITAAGSSMTSMEQTLIDPPNVSGWEGYRRWISTKTYPNRRQFASAIVSAMTDQELLDLAKRFPDYTDADKLTTALEMFFLPKSIAGSRHKYYLEEALLQKQPSYEWQAMLTNGTSAARGIKAVLMAFIKAPDFHLC